jgi:hypothetical protein
MARCGSMDSGVTTDGQAARSVPAEADGDAPCPCCPVTARKPGQLAKGSEVRVVRCTTHGIAYDSEREVCPECAKGAAR